MQSDPFQWGLASCLFEIGVRETLSRSFPTGGFNSVAGYDGEKRFRYHQRPLIALDENTVIGAGPVSEAWGLFREELMSERFRFEVGRLIERDLMDATLEANFAQFPVGSHIGPHVDRKSKIATVVIYFNDSWRPEHGGSLNILQSRDPRSIVAVIPPIIGNVAIIVRSEDSWHEVCEVVDEPSAPRRSVNVIFHR